MRGEARARSVRARSKAEVPVEVPRRASTDSVNGVPKRELFSLTMSRRPSRSAISGDIGAHRMPRPCLSAKLTVSGVAFSAANTRSPSFSRRASSTTTIILPARMRRSDSSTVMNTGSRPFTAGRARRVVR